MDWLNTSASVLFLFVVFKKAVSFIGWLTRFDQFDILEPPAFKYMHDQL